MTTTSLIDRLVRDGRLPDPAWRAAFTAVPREVFVPYFFAPNVGRPGRRLVEGDAEWLHGVADDVALVTQMNGDGQAVSLARGGGVVEGIPSSSSSAPGLMAAMLHALEVQDGHRVLEVGTGSGYNAALLTERLGSHLVTSVDVDAGLAARARDALSSAGYYPAVVAADGASGHPPGGPYDRIIATVALPRFPMAWFGQTGEGATVVLPLSLAGRGGVMATLRRTAAGASGPILGQYGGFMAARSLTEPAPPRIRAALGGSARPTSVPVAVLTDEHPAAFFISLSVPIRFRTLGFVPDGDDRPQTWGSGGGSEFVLTVQNGQTLVSAIGPLWSQIEAAHSRWTTLGEPSRERFGMTATAQRQWIWLDDPGQRIAELPPG